MSDVGSRIRHLESTEYMLTYAGNPNGLLDAAETTQCYDTLTGNLYINIDGAVSWALIGGGGGGGAPNSASYLVLGLNAGLTAERRFDPAARFAVVDGGPNADYDIDLAATGVVAGAYGSATQVGTFTVNAYGQLSAAANVAITGTPPAAHALLGAYHNDTAASAPARGSFIYGNAANQWAQQVHIGTANHVLTTTALDITWSLFSLNIAGNSTINGSLVGNMTGGGTVATGGFTGTIPATANFAMGAGTLTAATANDATIAAHTHAITDTSDGDTTPSTILSTDANGTLRVRRLGVGAAAIAVNGTIALPNAGYIGNGSATARLVFDSSGAQDYAHFAGCYVGINDTTPSYHLDVNGIIGINGEQTIYNAAALATFIATMYFGNGGGSLSHTGGVEGYYNTGIGNDALFSNTTGSKNFAGGFSSLYSNTSGYNNTAIGSYSGSEIAGGGFNSTSNNSVYIGYDTKSSANGNTNETVIGASAVGNGSNTTTVGVAATTDFYAFGNHVIENQHFVGITGDVRTVWDSTNNKIIEQLDDAAGTDKWSVYDSAPAEVAYINSNGGGYFAEGIGVGVAPIAASGTVTFPNAGYIGNGAALALLGFDSSGAQDYAYLSNCFVGIGLIAPESLLDVRGTGIAAATQPIITLSTPDNQAIAVGSELGKIQFSADDNSAGRVRQVGAMMRYVGGENWDASNSGGYLAFGVIGTAAETPADDMVLTRGVVTNETTFGVGTTAPAGKASIDQSSTTAAIPVLILDQADIDQVLIKAIGTAEAASANRTLVAASDFTTPGALVGWIQINIQDDGDRIADGDYYIPFYATPTA